MIVRGYRKDNDGNDVLTDIFDIIECTYNGTDMGERSITATVDYPSPINFQAGDYIELPMQSLERGNGVEGSVITERFYIYNMPTIKKTARPMTHGKAFEHNIVFYPAQHELSLVQMRDLGDGESVNSVIYTGFDTVHLYCGANGLMTYIMRVLALAYHDDQGNPLWSYEISNDVNEVLNKALEFFPFTFSGNTVMDALLKLNDKEGINTTFYINGRTIYVGSKRPYFCRVTDGGKIDTDKNSQMFHFEYGKTSHESIALDHGGLYEITKTVGTENPITKLFAYGASRNLNRYYCSDKVAPGRYVNRLMLPSFSNDGMTDYILSEEGVAKYGIREGSKQFEDIYPSLRYMTYGDIREIKYCIKVKVSGLNNDNLENPAYNVARVQCYKVVESDTLGVNKLVEAAPPDDIAVFVHALGKIVKVVLCGGATNDEAIAKQLSRDAKIPTRSKGGTDYIPGACFLVHDPSFMDSHDTHLLPREDWFSNLLDSSVKDKYTDEQITEIKNHQINYTDTFWLTELYKFTSYGQTFFDRTSYSAWAYPKLNSKYVSNAGEIASDTLLVNEIVAVEPIVVENTSANLVGVDHDKAQQTFDIYLRDVGFKIDEQNDFGENVFVLSGDIKVSFLDGKLAGQEFQVSGATSDSQWSCVCAFNDDGSLNDEFFQRNSYTGPEVPNDAFDRGAIWRLRCNRANFDDSDFSNLNIAIPNGMRNAQSGDHIVLLDIYMPDIYIKAAENRLLRDATKYLHANDKGKIDYTINLDKVRIQQIPNYALQMREGLRVRMVDEDLNISTINKIVKLFDGDLLTNTSMYETTYEAVPTWYQYENVDFFEIRKHLDFYDYNGIECVTENRLTMFEIISNNDGEWEGEFVARIMPGDKESGKEILFRDNKINIRLADSVYDTVYDEKHHFITSDYITLEVTEYSVSELYDLIFGKFIKRKDTALPVKTYENYSKNRAFDGIAEYYLGTLLEEEDVEYVPSTYILPIGSVQYAPTKLLIDFSANKHYQVVIKADHTDILQTNGDGYPRFVLMNGLSGDALMYEPNYTFIREDVGPNVAQFTFDFDLGSSFNDSHGYYPALEYVSDNITEYVATNLISITESDIDGLSTLDYADLNISSVTIKITDSTNRTFAQPIKEITATLSEQNNASSWTTLMSKVENTEKESDDNKRITESIIKDARRNYQSLLSLRDSIFDPDGTCTDTFLQVMMLQVGADSMNYYLDKTRVNADGTQNNCSCYFAEDSGMYYFKVHESDKLHHVVYTDQGGLWSIPNVIDCPLEPTTDNAYPTYFVSLKCSRFGSEGEWVCSTKQYAVNEEEGFWYFNWGIITADSVGVYTIMETRGNAYMYGDNLVCGKISSLAKNCWFDLTHGEFALGDNGDGTASLSYIDGVLTISGVPDEDTISNMISELIGEQTIGGENLLSNTALHHNYGMGDLVYFTKLISLEAGKKYVATYGKFENNAGGAANEGFNEVCLAIGRAGAIENIESVVRFGEPFEVNYNGRELYLAWAIYEYVNAAKGTSSYIETTSEFTQYLDEVMVQEGTIPTSFQPPLEYLRDALTDGTTEIAGGLILTNMLMLKNNTGVVSGMSGMKDNSSDNYGVSMWAGGSYSDALNQASSTSAEKTLPVLLTKMGIGSNIGCFEVVSMDEVAIYNQNRESRVLISAVDSAGRIGIKLQTLDNAGYIDKVIISDESIDTSIISKTLKGNVNVTVIKNAGDVWTNFETKETVVLDGTTSDWSTTMNSGQKLLLVMNISTGRQVRNLRFGTNSYLVFGSKMGNLFQTVWQKDISGLFADYIDSNGVVQFTLNLESVPSKLSAGTYCFKLIIGSFIRTNNLGYEYTETVGDDRFTEGSIGFSLIQDVHFTKVSDGDSNVIKVGKDGIKVSANSSSNFIVKSVGSELTVMMNGLPPSDPGVAGSLYVDGNTLKIS